jgi:M6 family metalloprotease-like protein
MDGIVRGRALVGAALTLLAGLCAANPAAAVSLDDFGYNRLQVRGVEARGNRPLLTIMVTFDGKPALAHDRAYYNTLVYNTLRKSVNGYFLVNSNGRFFWGRAGAGVIGPFRFSAATANIPERERLGRIKEVAMRSGFDFAQFDDDHNGHVDNNELAILIVDNITERGGARRSSQPGCVSISGSPVKVCSDVTAVGHRASFMTIAHELSHLLGTYDLYGSNDLNQSLTLMGATIYNADDDTRTYHLDAWHKMQLGWCEPRIRSLRAPGTDVLTSPTMVKPDAPVILYDPVRGGSEYFVLEYRSTTSRTGLHYDENVAGAGLVIWHVQQDGNKVPVLLPGLNGNSDYAVNAMGAPALARGVATPWGSGTETPTLRWEDGSSTGVRIAVPPFAPTASAIVVNWNVGWSGYHTLAGGMKGKPVVAQNADGRLEVFVRGLDNGLWHIWQLSGGGWSGWHSLGGGMTADPVVGRNNDGRLEVFIRGLDNGLWHIWQTFNANQPWSGWHSLGGGMTSEPAVGRNADGRLEVFTRGLDGALWHIWQGGPNAGWSGWASLGGYITTGPAVGQNKDGRLEVFARGGDNALWHIWQTFQAQPWSGWHSLGGGMTGQPAVGRNLDGRLEVFIRGLNGGLWHIWQGGPNAGWSGWESLGGYLTTDPVVAPDGRGRLTVFVRGGDNALWHIDQTFQAQPWTGWQTLGGYLSETPAVGRNADGRLEAFVRGGDNALYHQWQTP